MAKKNKSSDAADKEEGGMPVWEDRKKEWKDDEKVAKELNEIYASVMSGFDDKAEQNSNIERAWDVYNCVLNENQTYEGDSKVYLPIVHDAIEARVTRFCNMVFPQTGRYSDVLSSDAEVPYDIMALLDNNVERAGLRDNIVPGLIRSGDITGQYSVFMSWQKSKRNTIKKVQRPELEGEGGEVSSSGKIPDVEAETVDDSRPDVQVLDSRDLLILPASVEDVEDADVVAIALRMSKGKIREMIDSGEFDEGAGEELIENMNMAGREQQPNPDKKALNAAGIKVDSKGSKSALVYMVWSKLKLGGKRRRAMAYIAGQDKILSCKRNPYWSDRIPVITQAALKVNGSIWGTSRVNVIEKVQYMANDITNIGADSIKYGLLPVVIVDPEKNPRASSIVLTMGSIWQGDPNSIKVVEFPEQWSKAQQVVDMCRSQIMQTLGINPAMLPMGNAAKKPTQAQIAQEQQVAMESTADVVTILETGVLNKILRWFYEMDYQFRTKDIVVRRFGPVGIQAEMQSIAPVGVDTHYVFKWYGTEGTKSVQQIQQMISMLNVFKGLPPEMLGGRRLDAGPIIEQAANVTFGPRVAPKVLVDIKHELTVPPTDENTMLAAGFHVPVGPMDNDVEHLKAHALAAKLTGDPTMGFMVHMQAHSEQMAKKAQAQQPQPAAPPAGGPRPGGQAQPPTGPQQPPGAVSPDQQATQGAMPRMRG